MNLAIDVRPNMPGRPARVVVAAWHGSELRLTRTFNICLPVTADATDPAEWVIALGQALVIPWPKSNPDGPKCALDQAAELPF
jgi:hypothetical protein